MISVPVFSSLSHLHRFPINEIKIDRLFVENIDTNHSDKIIVESLVTIAHGLGLSLVAEGVETEKTFEPSGPWDAVVSRVTL